MEETSRQAYNDVVTELKNSLPRILEEIFFKKYVRFHRLRELNYITYITNRFEEQYNYVYYFFRDGYAMLSELGVFDEREDIHLNHVDYKKFRNAKASDSNLLVYNLNYSLPNPWNNLPNDVIDIIMHKKWRLNYDEVVREMNKYLPKIVEQIFMQKTTRFFSRYFNEKKKQS